MTTDPSAKEKSIKSTVSIGLRVHGLLLNADHQPVARETITIDNRPDVDENRRAREVYPDVPEVEEVKFTSISDIEGRFDFEPVPYAQPNRYSEFRIWARHGDLCVCESLDRVPTARERYYELVMLPEAILAGQVTDMQGNPIDKAFVMFSGVPSSRTRRAPCRTFTDKDGRFTFEFLAPGLYRVYINTSGFVPLQTPWVTAGDPNLVFQLDIGNSISGRVVDAATGKAIPGVGVRSELHLQQSWRYGYAETNQTGQFTLKGLESGTFKLSVAAGRDRRDVPYTLPEPVSVTLQAGRPVTGVELKAIMGAAVSGRVVEADTGRPPQRKVWVQAKSANEEMWQRGTKVNEDGSYTIQGFPPGQFLLSPIDPDKTYIETKKTVTIAGNTPVDGVDFSLVKLDKNSAKDQLLTGKVIDEAGAPVEGANVVAVPTEATGQQESGVITDADGEFAISFDQPPKKVYVQAFNYNAMSRRAGPIEPLGNSCTLLLEAAGRIEGAVVDEMGEPVAGAAVAAIGDQEEAASMVGSDVPWRAKNRVLGTKAGTSDTGAFSMPAVMPGAYRLEVYAPAASVDVPVATGRVQVRAGDTLRTRLVIDTKGLGTIEGSVTRNGTPLPDTQVAVFSADAPWMSSVSDQTDPSGHYVLPHIQPGMARVQAEIVSADRTSADFVRHTQTVDVAAGRTATADFNLDPRQTGAVEGYVYVNGALTNGIYVEFQTLNAEDTAGKTSAYTNREGWFHVEGLAEDTYIAEAWLYIQYSVAQFRLSDVQEVNVKAGETARIDFHLNAGRIEGTVSGIQKGQQAFVSLLDGSGNLFSLTPQVLQSMEDRVLIVLAVLRDGPFTFEGIPEGNYVLGAVSVPEDASQQEIAPALAAITAGRYTAAEVQIFAGETITVDLALP